RGNESCVREQRHVVAADHQPRSRDLEKDNERRAAGNIHWPVHGAPIMGQPQIAVCSVAHIAPPRWGPDAPRPTSAGPSSDAGTAFICSSTSLIQQPFSGGHG